MRYGDHNFRNRQLYEECHENPYYQKKLELMEKRKNITTIEDHVKEFWGKFAWCDLQNSDDNKRIDDWLRTTITTVRKEACESGMRDVLQRLEKLPYGTNGNGNKWVDMKDIDKLVDSLSHPKEDKEEQYKCKSYFEDGELLDCTCGKCF